jgi:hypothetical protein
MLMDTVGSNSSGAIYGGHWGLELTMAVDPPDSDDFSFFDGSVTQVDDLKET